MAEPKNEKGAPKGGASPSRRPRRSPTPSCLASIAPAAPRSSAVIALAPSNEYAAVIRPMRLRRSWRSRATAMIAITSDAAVMSKPVSRG